jgi:aminoglycoside phosphotransferase (APT) family kinase protein
VICHGDFHPLNVMMEDAGPTGVIDWSQAIVAEPAFDVAATRVILRFPNLGEPRWARGPLRLARRIAVCRYTRAYGAARRLDTRNLAYFEAMRVLHALLVAGTTPSSPRDPWNPPHTLAALYGHFESISGVKVRV